MTSINLDEEHLELRRAIWNDLSDKELLDMLEKEIYRLGMQDDPNRTDLQEKYDNNNMPSPNTYLKLFNCDWSALMRKIGLRYNGMQALGEKSSAFNTGKQHALRWGAMSRDELLTIVVDEMRRTGSYGMNEYRENRDKKNSPSLPVIKKYIGGWKEVKSEYVRKYGVIKGSGKVI